MNLEAFPLSWPSGFPRPFRRERARFAILNDNRQRKELTRYIALNRLRTELERLEATDVVVSTNVPVRRDGLPYSAVKEPDDPAVAVYFRLEGVAHCLPCGKWDRVADNLAAVAAHIYSLRAQSRYGVGDIKQAFAGYRALAAMPETKPWWTHLGFAQPPEYFETVKARRTLLLLDHHPDRGGSQSEAAEINAAYGEAEKHYADEIQMDKQAEAMADEILKEAKKKPVVEKPVEKKRRSAPSAEPSLADRFRTGAR